MKGKWVARATAKAPYLPTLVVSAEFAAANGVRELREGEEDERCHVNERRAIREHNLQIRDESFEPDHPGLDAHDGVNRSEEFCEDSHDIIVPDCHCSPF